MGATVLDGKATRDEIFADLRARVAVLHSAEVAGYLAPVPGGVGPMTRAMLLVNLVEAVERNARVGTERVSAP